MTDTEAADLVAELTAHREAAAAHIEALRVAHVRRGHVQEAWTQLRMINPLELREAGRARLDAALRSLEAALA